MGKMYFQEKKMPVHVETRWEIYTYNLLKSISPAPTYWVLEPLLEKPTAYWEIQSSGNIGKAQRKVQTR
jgi:hypothetical protein